MEKRFSSRSDSREENLFFLEILHISSKTILFWLLEKPYKNIVNIYDM